MPHARVREADPQLAQVLDSDEVEEAVGTPLPTTSTTLFGDVNLRGLGREFHIALRADGLGGAGTAEDPFDGSTAAKLKALFEMFAGSFTYITIRLGPAPEGAPFQLDVSAGFTGAAFYTKTGWKIVGSGMRTTCLQMVGNLAGKHFDFAAFKTNPAVSTDDVLISSLTIDCNETGLNLHADTVNGEKLYQSGGIALFGSYNTVQDVCVKHQHGSLANSAESFGIALRAPEIGHGVHNQILDSWGEASGGTYGAPFALFGSQDGTYKIKYSRALRCTGNSGVNNGLKTPFNTGGVNLTNCVDCEVSGCLFVDCFGIVYLDTGTIDGLRVADNTCVRGWMGIGIVPANSTVRRISIIDNILGLQNRDPDSRAYGMLLGQASNTTGTDIQVAGNTLTYSQTGGGYGEFASIVVSYFAGVRAEGNTSDAATFTETSGVQHSTSVVCAGNRTHTGQGLPELPDQTAVSQVDGLAVGALRFTAQITQNDGILVYTWTLGDVLLAAGDKLEYEVMFDPSSPNIALYAALRDGNGDDIGNNILFDQNLLSYIAYLTAYAKSQWYFRQFDLTPFAGQTAVNMAFGIYPFAYLADLDPTGTYIFYLRHVRIVDAQGRTKKAFYTEEVKNVPVWGSGSHYTGDSARPNFGIEAALVYVANLTQSGAGNPVATVMENTLGNLVWTRTSAGVYVATLAGAFSGGAAKVWLALGSQIPDAIDAAPPKYSFVRTDNNTLTLVSGISDDADHDDKIAGLPVAIRVYQ